ncbi:MAG: DNA internalization-related competence protein ComEC/Rec2 [Phycisphaerae bacterium]|nr:DNA internalization-related competence protein ComEC/Rec2 [Phycisphaerae bacterium]
MTAPDTTSPAATEAAAPDRLANALATAPLLLPAIGMAAGIAIDAHWAIPTSLCLTLFLAGMPLLTRYRDHTGAGAAAIMLASLAVGAMLHHNAYRRIAADHCVRYTDAEPIPVCLTGRLVTDPMLTRPDYGALNRSLPRPARSRFLVEAESLEGATGPITVSGLVRVHVREPLLRLRTGGRVRMVGRLYRPPPPDNVGQRDWRLHSRRAGVLVGLSCEHAASVTRLDNMRASAGWLVSLRRHARGFLLDAVDPTTDSASLTLLDAVILGQRSAVETTINDAFVATGTVHLLCVSGVHVGMLAGVVWSIVALFGCPRRQAAILVIVAVLAYAGLAEPNPPILRATITTTLLCVSLLLRRPVQITNWLAASALLILIVRPTDLFNAGFQLSFITLAGVLYLSRAVHDTGRQLLLVRRASFAHLTPPGPPPPLAIRLARASARRLGSLLAVAVAAWLAGAPLALYHFGQIGTWGWLNSLLVTPLVGVLMLAGFAKLIASALWPSLGALLGPVVAWLSTVTDAWVRLLADVPGVAVVLASPPLWLVMATLVVLGLWAARRMLAIPGHVIAIGLCACLVAGVFWHLPSRPNNDELRVRILAVGNGSATVIRLPNGRAMLYDVGRYPPYELYRSTLAPALAAERIRRLDAVVLSHANLDHYSGLLDLADHVPIGEVWLTSHFFVHSRTSRIATRILAELDRRGIAIRIVHAGDQITGTGNTTIEIVWPPPPEASYTLDANDASLVLRLSHGGRSILLCGDIEEHPQKRLAEEMTHDVDVLVLPHHGSFKPWTARFVRGVAPAFAIRSSGTRNSHNPLALNELMSEYAYFNTADVGSILVRLSLNGITVSHTKKVSPISPHVVKPTKYP